MWGEIAQAAASTVNTGLNLWGAEKAQDTDVQLFHEANKFNAHEAHKQREWQDSLADIQRHFNLDSMRESMNFNAAETEKNRQFNKLMAETEYQRAVGDLGKAGLNPMLAYMKGGTSVQGSSAASAAAASTGIPSGASASSVSPPRARNIMGEAASSALKALEITSVLARQDAETDLIRANTEKTLAEVPKVIQETKTSESSAANLDAQTKQINEVMRKIGEEINLMMQQRMTETERGNLLRVQQRLEEARISNVGSDTQLKRAAEAVNNAKAALLGQDIQRSANEEAKAKTWWGRNVSPYLADIFKSHQIIRGAGEAIKE